MGEDLKIAFEDEWILVIDKPPFIASEPSAGYTGDDALSMLMANGKILNADEAVVSRLDVGTSGLMLLTKSGEAFEKFKELFKNREIHKTYIALVQGYLENKQAVIDAPIGRRAGKDIRMGIVKDGKPAITQYRVIEEIPKFTLVEARPKTGRTHQIRVHFASIKHPIAGDIMYGANPDLANELGLKRPFLHSANLEFTHPFTSSEITLTSPLPPDLVQSFERR